VAMREKIITEPVPGRASLVVDYIATGKWNDEVIYFQSITN